MRATTAFNKMLAIPGAHVVGVCFGAEGIEVSLRARARRLRCACGWSTRAAMTARCAGGVIWTWAHAS